MLTEHPMGLAREMARLLESDIVAAGQIKEHIQPERLAEMLGINIDHLRTEAEDIEGLLEEHPELDEHDALEFVLKTFTRSQILAALNDEAA